MKLKLNYKVGKGRKKVKRFLPEKVILILNEIKILNTKEKITVKRLRFCAHGCCDIKSGSKFD